MAEKRYVMRVTVILGISVLLILFTFILVAHNRDVPERVRLQRGELLRSGSSVAERIKPVARLEFAAEETRKEPEKAAPAPSRTRDGQQVYQASCVACHGAGVAGAPKLDDKGQWTKRIGKGVNTLYLSAINGVQSSAGVMPAKGGNPALSDAEVRAAVDYMVARAK